MAEKKGRLKSHVLQQLTVSGKLHEPLGSVAGEVFVIYSGSIRIPVPVQLGIDIIYGPATWLHSVWPIAQIDIFRATDIFMAPSWPTAQIDISSHFEALPLAIWPTLQIDIFRATDILITSAWPTIQIDISVHFEALPSATWPMLKSDIIYIESIALATADLVQPPDVLLSEVLTSNVTMGELLEPTGTIEIIYNDDIKGCGGMIIPNDTFEKPNLYRPDSKPPGFLHVVESQLLSQDLMFHLSSSDAILAKDDNVKITRFGKSVTTTTPKNVISERGMVFSFDGITSGIRFNQKTPLLFNNEYSLFTIFKTRPPCFSLSVQYSILFSIAWGVDTGLLYQMPSIYLIWDFPDTRNRTTARLRVQSNHGGELLVMGFINTDVLEALPKWYVLGLSSSSTLGLRMYHDGIYNRTLVSRYPKVANHGGHGRRLDIGIIRDTDIFDHLDYYADDIIAIEAPWKGDMLVFYEWARVLSDAEHASLALDPFQLFDATSSHE